MLFSVTFCHSSAWCERICYNFLYFAIFSSFLLYRPLALSASFSHSHSLPTSPFTLLLFWKESPSPHFSFFSLQEVCLLKTAINRHNCVRASCNLDGIKSRWTKQFRKHASCLKDEIFHFSEQKTVDFDRKFSFLLYIAFRIELYVIQFSPFRISTQCWLQL